MLRRSREQKKCSELPAQKFDRFQTLRNNMQQGVQTDPTLLRYASAITEQKNCWELLAEKFDRFQTLRNNIQQHATGCAKGRNM